MLLVPDLVTAFTAAPEWMPFWALRPPVATLNSCSASGNGNGHVQVVLRVVVHGPVEHVRDAEGLAARHGDAETSRKRALRRGDGLHRRSRDHHQFNCVAPLSGNGRISSFVRPR
jgi:hypothetical protein